MEKKLGIWVSSAPQVSERQMESKGRWEKETIRTHEDSKRKSYGLFINPSQKITFQSLSTKIESISPLEKRVLARPRYCQCRH